MDYLNILDCPKEQHSQDFEVEPEVMKVVRESKDGRWVFVSGHILDDVLESPNIGVIYVPTLSSINKESYLKISKVIENAKKVYSVENHFTIGGLGDFVSETFNVVVNRIGLERKFLTNYGNFSNLRRDAGMDRESIITKNYREYKMNKFLTKSMEKIFNTLGSNLDEFKDKTILITARMD